MRAEYGTAFRIGAGVCLDCGGRCDRRAQRCAPCATPYRARSGPESATWKGGVTTTSHGYVKVKRRDHPDADASGYVYQHRLVAAEAIGRQLAPGESVHHRNGDRKDNRPENLEVLTASEHALRHARGRGSLTMEAIKELLRSGLTVRQIARPYRVTERRIAQARREMGSPCA